MATKRIESYSQSKRSALYESRLRKMPVLIVKEHGKKMVYLVTSAPKTVIKELKHEGIQAKLLSTNESKKKKHVSWLRS